MVSDFIEQHNGFLRIPEFQAQHAGLFSLNTGLRRRDTGTASDLLAMSKMQSRSLNSSTHRGGTCIIVFVFDQSSCHKAYTEDALNASRMNVRPGRKQPCMRDIVWAGKVQKMVRDDGVAKGM